MIEMREPPDLLTFGQLASLHPKQAPVIRAMTSRERPIILAGGSGYGGKSYVLRASAIFMHLLLYQWGHKGSKTVFCSATYESLRDRHFDYFESEWGAWGSIRDGHRKYGRCFLFHNSDLGAICLRNLSAVRERKGTEYGGGFIDESTEILRSVFGDFLYMVRKPDVPHRPVVLGSNPDGVGHHWNKAMFRPWLPPNIKENGLVDQFGKPLYDVVFPKEREARFPSTVDPMGEEDAADYMYIPFLPDDNPKFDEKLFWRMVAHLPEHVQRARRYGTWDTPEGARFPYLREQDQLFSLEDSFPQGIPMSWKRIVHIDYGLRAPYCCLWTAIDYDGNPWTYREDYKAGLTADIQASRVVERTKPDEIISEGFLDPAMWSRPPQHSPEKTEFTERSAASYYEEMFQQDKYQRFPHALRRGYNRSRIIALATLDMLLRRGNGFPDWRIEAGCAALWGELTGAIFAQGSGLAQYSEDLDKNSPDHAITAAYYGFHNFISSPVSVKVEEPIDVQAIMDKRRKEIDEESERRFIRDTRRNRR